MSIDFLPPAHTGALLGATFSVAGGSRRLMGILGLKKGKPLLRLDDLSWIEALPSGDAMAAMTIILQRLEVLIPALNPLEPSQVSCSSKTAEKCENITCDSCIHVMSVIHKISKSCNCHLSTLEKQYASIQKLAPKVDDQIWDSVNSYYRLLIRAYQSSIDKYIASPGGGGLQSQHAFILIAHAIDNMCNSARWYCMRYKNPPDEHWKTLHRLYQAAEKLNCTKVQIKFHNGTENTINSRYLRALMLNTINFSGMLKAEVACVDEWLNIWMKNVTISNSFDPDGHLFYVNLEEDFGARRIRHMEHTKACRYWGTDRIVDGIPVFRKLLSKGEKHIAFEIVRTSEVDQYLKLLDHLHAEWSRDGYRRQRRREERIETVKAAYVSKGFHDAYRMTKDFYSASEQRKGYKSHSQESLEERLSRHSVVRSAPSLALPWLSGQKWLIQDQSVSGFGAIVADEVAKKLTIGKLLAMVDDENRDSIVIGVVRSIKNQLNGQHHIGIESIAHSPVPVSITEISSLQRKAKSQAFVSGDDPFVMLEQGYWGLLDPATPDMEGVKPSVIIAMADYMQGAVISISEPGRDKFKIKLGEVLEHKDDWVRVAYEK